MPLQGLKLSCGQNVEGGRDLSALRLLRGKSNLLFF